MFLFFGSLLQFQSQLSFLKFCGKENFIKIGCLTITCNFLRNSSFYRHKFCGKFGIVNSPHLKFNSAAGDQNFFSLDKSMLFNERLVLLLHPPPLRLRMNHKIVVVFILTMTLSTTLVVEILLLLTKLHQVKVLSYQEASSNSSSEFLGKISCTLHLLVSIVCP